MRFASLAGFNSSMLIAAFAATASPSATSQDIRFGCVQGSENYLTIRFTHKPPAKGACQAVYPVDELAYASAKGVVTGYTAKLNATGDDLVLELPNAYSLGANRIVNFRKFDGTPMNRRLTFHLDTETLIFLKDEDGTGRGFSLPRQIRERLDADDPVMVIDYGERDVKEIGSNIERPGRVDKNWCGDLIAYLKKPECTVVGPGLQCAVIRDLGTCDGNSRNISIVDASIVRRLRPFDIKVGSTYTASYALRHPQRRIACRSFPTDRISQLLIQDMSAVDFKPHQIDRVLEIAARDLALIRQSMKNQPVETISSTYRWANQWKGIFSPKIRRTVLIYEFQLCGVKNYQSIFYVVNVEKAKSAVASVRENTRLHLIANAQKFVAFYDQLVASGLDELVAMGVTLRVSTMKRIGNS